MPDVLMGDALTFGQATLTIITARGAALPLAKRQTETGASTNRMIGHSNLSVSLLVAETK